MTVLMTLADPTLGSAAHTGLHCLERMETLFRSRGRTVLDGNYGFQDSRTFWVGKACLTNASPRTLPQTTYTSTFPVLFTPPSVRTQLRRVVTTDVSNNTFHISPTPITHLHIHWCLSIHVLLNLCA
jgi:hypothetical protein